MVISTLVNRRPRVRTSHPAYDSSEITAQRGTKKAPSCSEPSHSHASFGEFLLAGIVLLILLLGWTTAAPPTAEAAAFPTLKRCALIRDTLTRRSCIIRSVFREEGRFAVRVAYCESRLDPRARNGQYRGVFQMGAAERARFGHGRSVLSQARAAKRYHAVAGWSPWSCS